MKTCKMLLKGRFGEYVNNDHQTRTYAKPTVPIDPFN